MRLFIELGQDFIWIFYSVSSSNRKTAVIAEGWIIFFPL